MMKKMNKKLLGSLILGLMLSAPVSQVNAIQLNGGVSVEPVISMGIIESCRKMERLLPMTLAGVQR